MRTSEIRIWWALTAIAALLFASSTRADDAAAMMRKLQNPLANIRALMTDNAIGFNTGTDKGTSYSFQLQPVYAIDFPEREFTLVPRGVIPVLGLEPGTDVPPIGSPSRNTTSQWGLGDSTIQLFYAPYVEGEWKWGIGPQVSIPTHTRNAFNGPGWGLGIAGVLTGPISDNLSFSALVGNHWGRDNDFNTLLLQPMLFYSIEQVPGMYIAYNAAITADWSAPSDNRWTVPIGLTVGRTFDIGNGNGLDVGVGPYYNIERPDGAADWQVRFAVTWLAP